MSFVRLFASLVLALLLAMGALTPTANAGMMVVWTVPTPMNLTSPGVLSGEYLGGVSAWTHDLKINGQTVLDDSTEHPGDTWQINVPAGPLWLSIVDHSTWIERFIGGSGGNHFLWNFHLMAGGGWSAKILYEDLPDYMLSTMVGYPQPEGVEPDYNDSKHRIWFTPAEVPEPTTFSLIGVSLVGLGIARRRRRFAQVGSLQPSKWLGRKIE
jgi:hypothetical protein